MTDTAAPTTPAIAPKLAAALVAALGELEDIEKSKKAAAGSNRAYMYADLAAVLEQVRPVLARHSLAVMQAVETEPGDQAAIVSIITTVVHVSGASHRSPPLRLTAPNDPQKVGSAITYGRRYSLLALLGIAAVDEDDDGAAATHTVSEPSVHSGRGSVEGLPHTPTPKLDYVRILGDQQPPRRARLEAAQRERYGSTLPELPIDKRAEALSFVVDLLAELDEQDALRADADEAHNDAETGDHVAAGRDHRP
jgi:hypothetical protein